MVTIASIEDNAIRMDHFYFGSIARYGKILEKSSYSLEIEIFTGIEDHFSGINVKYNSDNEPISGYITGFQHIENGILTFSLQNLHIDAANFYGYISQDLYGIPYTGLSFFFSENDTMTGSSKDDWLASENGHDNVFGGAGSDFLGGGAGNDHLYGQSPNGGPDGNDTISGGDGADYIQGNAGNDSLDGNSGSDRIQGGQGNDRINGNLGNDTVNGNLGNDEIHGGTGDDSLRGGRDNDLIFGNQGNDVIFGDLGDDTLAGGSGTNILTGGEGSDVFQVFSKDMSEFDKMKIGIDGLPVDMTTITDFTVGIDRLATSTANPAIYATAPSFADAITYAQAHYSELVTHSTSGAGTLLIGVGSDTYMFYSNGYLSLEYQAVVRLVGIDPHQINQSNLTGDAVQFPTYDFP